MSEFEKTVSELIKIGKKPVIAQIGGFRPLPNEKSWFGGNFLKNMHDSWPEDKNGRLSPVIQIFVPDVPGGSEIFGAAVLIQVFLTQGKFPIGPAKNGNGWLLKAYSSIEKMVLTSTPEDAVLCKCFPIHWLTAKENDYPDWEEAHFHVDFSGLNQSELKKLDYFEKFPCYLNTKIGGYASYIQGAKNQHFKFVFQVSSEAKPMFMVGHAGNLYFYKEDTSNDWHMDWDCY